MSSAVRPVNTPRVTMLMQSSLLMNSIRSNSVDLLKVQNQLTTGLKIGRPSDSPALASSIMNLDTVLERQFQYFANINQVSMSLDFAWGAMGMVVSATSDAHTTALDAIGQDGDHRVGLLGNIGGIIDGMINAANTQDEDGYFIFGGQSGAQAPFVSYDGGVLFTGDLNSLTARVSDGIGFDLSVSAQEAFNLTGNVVSSGVDLNPAMTADTLLSDLNGALSQGVRLGTIQITDGTDTANVDLSNAVTVGDVISKIENAGVAGITGVVIESGVGGTNLRIDGTVAITVSEVGSGYTARDLGINGTGNPLTGQDVDARLSAATPIAALAPGVGIDSISGFTISNNLIGSGISKTITFAGTDTLGDVIRAINDAEIGARAQINADGTGIEVYNLLSGSEMRIDENGGTTAADLGIRSMTGTTKLADLNGGEGVYIEQGAVDIILTDSNDVTHDINLDGSETINDVIAAINAVMVADGTLVTASFSATSNGIVITDTNGVGTDLRVTENPLRDGGYFTAQQLGLQDRDNPNIGSVINGTDVNPVTVDSIFSELLSFKTALGIASDSDADAALLDIGGRLEQLHDTINNVYGGIGMQLSTLADRKNYMEDKILATETLRSDIADIDFTEAITRYQNLYTAMQANLMTGGQMSNISLLDFLR